MKVKTWIEIILYLSSFLLLSFFLVKCSSGNDQASFQEIKAAPKVVSLYIDNLPYDVDPIYLNALREARSFWEKRTDVSFKEVSSTRDADILVKWVKEFGGATLGHTYHSDFIEMGLGDSRCLKKWQPYTYAAVLDVATHELGHILGYKDDYNNTKSVMYYQTTTKYEADIEETEVLSERWVRFYPVCTKNSVATYSFTVISDEPLDVYVVPSKQEYDHLMNNEGFNYYPDCAGNGVKFYKKVCTVKSGSGIILKKVFTRFSSEPTRFTIKIKEI